MSSTLSSLCTFSPDILQDNPCGCRFQLSGSPLGLSFSGMKWKVSESQSVTFRIGVLPTLVWTDCQKSTFLPCKVSLRRKRPPTWWSQNSTHHFYWRTCGSLYILERTISAAIYLRYEPVNTNHIIVSSSSSNSAEAANITDYNQSSIYVASSESVWDVLTSL